MKNFFIVSLYVFFFSFLIAGCHSTVSSQKNIHEPSIDKTKSLSKDNKDLTKPQKSLFQHATIKDAFDIYRTSVEKKTGIYEYQGLVFVVVNVEYGKQKLHRRLAKGTAMLRAKKMLQNKYNLPAKIKIKTHQIEAKDIYREKLYRYTIVCYHKDLLILSK